MKPPGIHNPDEQFLYFLPALIFFRHRDMSYLGLTYRSDFSDILLLFFASYPQFFHYFLIGFRMKQFSKNHFFIIWFCPQQFHKLTLCDHSHLHKLPFRQSQDFYNFFVRLFFVSGKFCLIRQDEGYRLFLFCCSMATLYRPDMPWGTPHGINLPADAIPLRKSQFHKRWNLRICILALQLISILLIHSGTCFSIQRKYNSIKDRCLTCTGITGDQKQILLRSFKINCSRSDIRTKCLHR